MTNYIIFIPIGIIAVIAIGLIIYLISSSNKTKEKPASILDVNEVGVPSSSEFSYGYEKEETIVMNPVNPEEKSDEKIKNKKEEKEANEEFPDVSEDDVIDITTTIKSFNKDEE